MRFRLQQIQYLTLRGSNRPGILAVVIKAVIELDSIFRAEGFRSPTKKYFCRVEAVIAISCNEKNGLPAYLCRARIAAGFEFLHGRGVPVPKGLTIGA